MVNAVGSRPADHREFERLMRPTYPRMYGLALKLLGNREDAEDIAQEACFRAYRSFTSYDRSRPFDSWMFAIVHRLCIDAWRKRRKAKVLELDRSEAAEGKEDLFLEIPDLENDPEKIVLDQFLSEEMEDALQKLSEMWRVPLILCRAQEQSYEQIAQELGMPIGTVKSRVTRATAFMRNLLEGTSIHQKAA